MCCADFIRTWSICIGNVFVAPTERGPLKCALQVHGVLRHEVNVHSYAWTFIFKTWIICLKAKLSNEVNKNDCGPAASSRTLHHESNKTRQAIIWFLCVVSQFHRLYVTDKHVNSQILEKKHLRVKDYKHLDLCADSHPHITLNCSKKIKIIYIYLPL